MHSYRYSTRQRSRRAALGKALRVERQRSPHAQMIEARIVDDTVPGILTIEVTVQTTVFGTYTRIGS